jgi:hypothetical protein
MARKFAFEKERQLIDEIIVPIISLLVFLSGVLGFIGFVLNVSLDINSILAFITSIVAIPAGIALFRYYYLGWAMSLGVIGVSLLLLLANRVSPNFVLDPAYFLLFIVFYCLEAYYLLIRRNIFDKKPHLLPHFPHLP